MMAGHFDVTRHPLLLRAFVEIVVVVMCLEVVERVREGFDNRFLNDRACTVYGIHHREPYDRSVMPRLLFGLGQCRIRSRRRVGLGQQTGRVWK